MNWVNTKGGRRKSRWTAEQNAEIARLYKEGHSASQIGRVLGATRNAIVGKLSRLGLLGPFSPRRPTKPAQARFKPGLVPTPPSLPPEPAPLAKPPTPIRNGFQEFWHCRWPSGDPATEEFRFCGGQRQFPGPYCAHHEKIAFNIPQRKTA